MRKYRILVVEDESLAAFALKETLEGFGHEVTGLATTAEEALKEVQEMQPDLVLMDIHLDEKEGGIIAGKQIMEGYGLPVVFLTAYADKETISRAKEAFPYGYMLKPYEDIELWAVIETAVHKHLADKKQRELHATKDKFFSIVAHDLRSPLAALSVTTRMLNKKVENMSLEQLKGFLFEIHQTVENIYNFTDNLLEWTRIRSGRLQVYPEVFQIQELVEEVCILLKGNALEKEVSFQSSLTTNEQVRADKNMLRSVLLNLLQNSLKFSQERATVKIGGRAEGAHLHMYVEDEGIGMSQEHLRKLFDETQRVHTLGTREEKGTGLGLLLCKEFVEANGGTIAVESTKGRGTRVLLSLPAGNPE